MTLDLVMLLGGGIAVWLGAEGLVRGAVSLAAYLGVPSLIVGLTVVAFGTSAPELVVSVIAALQGHSQMALGNVIGSNLINIGLVLGVSVVITPIVVSLEVLKREVPIVAFATVAVVVLAFIGDSIGKYDAIILLVGFVGYSVMNYKLVVVEQARTNAKPGWKRPPFRARHVVFIVGGMVVLALGAKGMVDGAVGIANYFHVSKKLIGVTIVAFGTSLPELAASVVAARHGEGDLALGNVVGSNLYNILLVLGTAALIAPIECQVRWDSFDLIFFVLMIFVLFPLLRFGWKLSRGDGCILLAFYALSVMFLFV